ncbi:hypothetical protein ABZ746_21115 [Streptomyces sp. NPDC020096]
MTIDDLTVSDLDYLQHSGFEPPRLNAGARLTQAPRELRTFVRVAGIGQLEKTHTPTAGDGRGEVPPRRWTPGHWDVRAQGEQSQVAGTSKMSNRYTEEFRRDAVTLVRLVEKYDEAGNRTMLLPVEMSGYRFEGRHAAGTPGGEPHHGRRIQAKTTPKIVMAFAILFALFILGFIAWGWIMTFTGGKGL